MRVDVRRGLVVGVAENLHGDQRIDASLEKQRREIVPKVMRRERGLVMLENIVFPLCLLQRRAPFHAMRVEHQAEPDAFEAGLRPRLAVLREEYILARKTAHFC